jgi:hypothetical protein
MNPLAPAAPESGADDLPRGDDGAGAQAPDGPLRGNSTMIRGHSRQADDGTRLARLLRNNAALTPMKNLVPEHLGWRIKPGILGQHASSPKSVHALLGYFLKDRESPTPFPGGDRLAREGLFDCGLGPPLEKVIEGPQHLQHLLQVPELYRQSVATIEPWPDAGTNPRGEQVRASKIIAYMLQQIADADTILYPVWRSGIENPGRLANVLSAGIATVVQGGNPSVHDARSFDGGKASLEELLSLVDELLLRRSTGSGPSIFICLGHQLAAASHIRLLRCAAAEILNLAQLPMDASGRALAALQRLCQRVVEVGESLPVIKSGDVVATCWNHPSFAVARNESLAIGTRRLMHYAQRGDRSHVPEELHATHALAVSPASWLLSLPYAVEMLGQTRVDDVSWTEVSSTAIYYKDRETRRIRRSFTCQLHPELMADIRDIGGRSGPRYQELTEKDGVRLFMQLLYHGMQE